MIQIIVIYSILTSFIVLETETTPKCPNKEHTPTYLPHESNCSLYYECSNGIAVLMHCPQGMEFSEILDVCVDPPQSGCAYTSTVATKSTGHTSLSTKTTHIYTTVSITKTPRTDPIISIYTKLTTHRKTDIYPTTITKGPINTTPFPTKVELSTSERQSKSPRPPLSTTETGTTFTFPISSENQESDLPTVSSMETANISQSSQITLFPVTTPTTTSSFTQSVASSASTTPKTTTRVWTHEPSLHPVDPDFPIYPVDPDHPIQPVDPDYPIQPVDPEDHIDIDEPVHPTELVYPTSTLTDITQNNSDSSKITNLSRTNESLKTTPIAIHPVDADYPIHPVNPDEPVNPIDTDYSVFAADLEIEE